jgi:NADH-quinone oxidoreductase subunit L
MLDLVYLIPLVPLLGFLILGLFGKAIKKEAIIGTIGSGAVGVSLVLAILIFLEMLSNPISSTSHRNYLQVV